MPSLLIPSESGWETCGKRGEIGAQRVDLPEAEDKRAFVMALA
jgi:hypothetical protein